MKFNTFFILSVLLNLIVWNGFSQNYNDTLSYKSGMVRYADIAEHHNKVIKYYYTNSKGERKFTSVNTGKLKYFVICDSTNQVVYDSRVKKK